jgi:hypothetical protein
MYRVYVLQGTKWVEVGNNVCFSTCWDYVRFVENKGKAKIVKRESWDSQRARGIPETVWLFEDGESLRNEPSEASYASAGLLM